MVLKSMLILALLYSSQLRVMVLQDQQLHQVIRVEGWRKAVVLKLKEFNGDQLPNAGKESEDTEV